MESITAFLDSPVKVWHLGIALISILFAVYDVHRAVDRVREQLQYMWGRLHKIVPPDDF